MQCLHRLHMKVSYLWTHSVREPQRLSRLDDVVSLSRTRAWVVRTCCSWLSSCSCLVCTSASTCCSWLSSCSCLVCTSASTCCSWLSSCSCLVCTSASTCCSWLSSCSCLVCTSASICAIRTLTSRFWRLSLFAEDRFSCSTLSATSRWVAEKHRRLYRV